jgi:molybdenum cofactor biosynthesis enzyme MoaA
MPEKVGIKMNDTRKMLKILKHCIIKDKKPTKIWVEVTDACNSRCIHCNIWKKERTTNQLTVDEYRDFFNDPYLSDINEVIISGGEPMMRKDIKQIVPGTTERQY